MSIENSLQNIPSSPRHSQSKFPRFRILGILGIPIFFVFYNFESDRRKSENMENIGKFLTFRKF